jgi:osmotically-inducible protein OsmY
LALPDGELQTQIQNALSKEPTLSGDTVNVNVSPDAIDVNGTVATAREKQTATRIVQSYAGNKKVITHLNITGRNRNAAGTATPPK